MYYTGKLTDVEIYDRSTAPYTNVREVRDNLHNKHPGRCIVVNAHWHNPGPEYIGNYKVKGRVLSEDYPAGQTGFGWDEGELPRIVHDMSTDNFVSTILALVDGERQWLDYQAGVIRPAARTWLGVDAAGRWTVEVTTDNYTLDGIVDRMEDFGIVDGMVFDGSGSSQWYDGETRLSGDGRTIYSYLLCWFAEEEGEKEEDKKPVTYRKGIDVSKWQGAIDWEKVKANGVEFAMLRAGYGQGNIDEQFRRNADECTRLGIPFGVYWFSYAYNIGLAEREAEYCLETVKPYKLSYPIAFDFEYDSVDYAADNGITVSKALASSLARAFLNAIEAAGYYGILYANPNYLSSYFEDDIPERYDIWLAKWPKEPDISVNPGPGGMWQYTSSGAVDGINGRVDMNVAYRDYPAIIGQPEPGKPEEEDKPMTWEEEQQAATAWVKSRNLSDGERPNDGVKRVELWVTLWRFYKQMVKLIKEVLT